MGACAMFAAAWVVASMSGCSLEEPFEKLKREVRELPLEIPRDLGEPLANAFQVLRFTFNTATGAHEKSTTFFVVKLVEF